MIVGPLRLDHSEPSESPHEPTVGGLRAFVERTKTRARPSPKERERARRCYLAACAVLKARDEHHTVQACSVEIDALTKRLGRLGTTAIDRERTEKWLQQEIAAYRMRAHLRDAQWVVAVVQLLLAFR